MGSASPANGRLVDPTSFAIAVFERPWLAGSATTRGARVTWRTSAPALRGRGCVREGALAVEAREEAERIVEEDWPLITRVAELLHEHGTLDDHVVRVVLAG